MIVEDLLDSYTLIDGHWVIARPARASGFLEIKLRIRDAWAVLTGKKDAVSFYKQ